VTGAGRKVQAGWRYPRDLGPWPPACPPGRLSAYVAARTFIRRRWFDASVPHALAQDGFRDAFRRAADRLRVVRLRVVSAADGSLDTDTADGTVGHPGSADDPPARVNRASSRVRILAYASPGGPPGTGLGIPRPASRSVAPSGMPGGMPMVTFSSRRPRPLGRKSRAGRV